VDYQYQHKLRSPFEPQSAPFFDTVNKPKSYPKITGCLSYQDRTTDICFCNTQQGTIVNLPRDMCLAYIATGVFDYSKDDSTIEQAELANLPRASLTTSESDTVAQQ
jgi:hypothetical protein